MLKYHAVALMAGFILDLLFGDPKWMYNPVIFIGKTISFLEKNIRKILPKTPAGELAGGVALVLITLIVSGGIPCIILYAAGLIHPVIQWAAGAFMCYQLLAVKCLRDESMKVYDALKRGTIEDGRHAVSMIVGRDTQALDEKGVVKAAVETVAENFSDGVLAPMLYMLIGGPVLMFIYKGINTMDSMVGYKNEKYQYFGSAAAKFDDVVNYIPARLSAWLMILASAITHMDWKNAKKIFLRDRYNHKSPNSAQTESVMAGALDVQLAGDAWYFGKLCKKPTIGDAIREIEPEDIRRSHTLLYMTAVLALVVFEVVKVLVCLWYFTVQV